VAAAVIEAALATATAERSRNLELQADGVGEAVARAVGYPKGSMGAALGSIAGEHERTRLFDTHPSTPRRVERLESSKGPRLCIRIVRKKT
jgi:Zn-dependent protease with chaperone function